VKKLGDWRKEKCGARAGVDAGEDEPVRCRLPAFHVGPHCAPINLYSFTLEKIIPGELLWMERE